ncbi:MAG: hypothetical protein ACLPPF_11655 [Rhodomicrobium sp.]
MQSECMAAAPQFVCSYAWKVPPARPAIFERAQKLIHSNEKCERDAAPAEHPSIPWKAYLASREFQHLASDLAEAFFKAHPAAGGQDAVRPASLKMNARALPGADGETLQGLLAPALPDGADTGSQKPEPGQEQRNLAVAA